MLAMRRNSYISLLVCIVYATNVLSQNQYQCADYDNNCSVWVRKGYCSLPERNMHELCPLSCNFCEQTTQPRRTIINPDFDCGRPHKLAEVVNVRKSRQVSPHYSQPEGGASRQDNGNPAETQTNLRVEDTVCGASVIHPRFILTAAHCVLDPTRPVSSVRLGELDFSQDDEANSRPVDYQIHSIFVHPDYDPNLVERYNDLALLHTELEIQFNEVVYPYCLSPTRPLPGAVVTVSGFGKVNATSHTPVLQEGELSIVDLATCESDYSKENLLSALAESFPKGLQRHALLCAGHPGRGACEGDGGGPLFQKHQDGRTFLYGMVSVAMACKSTELSNLPGIYVSIADHIEFIDSILYGY